MASSKLGTKQNKTRRAGNEFKSTKVILIKVRAFSVLLALTVLLSIAFILHHPREGRVGR